MTNEVVSVVSAELDDIPVFIVRTAPREAIVIREGADEGRTDWVSLAQEALGPIAEMLPGRGAGGSQARKFVLDDASLELWDTLERRGKNGYSFGTLWGSDGKIASQVKLKEISAAPVAEAATAINPMAIAQLALLVSIKADIARLENAVSSIAADVKSVLRFLEVEQESEVLAALHTIHEVHTRLRATGRVVREDWERVSGLEQSLKAVERQVLSEMTTIADAMKFNTVSGAKTAIESVSAVRLEQLKFLLIYDLWAQDQWTEILLARRRETGSLDAIDLELAGKAIQEARNRALEILCQVEEVSNPEARIHGSSPLKLLTSRGLVIGWQHESKIMKSARSLRQDMREVAVERSAIEPSPTELLEVEVSSDNE